MILFVRHGQTDYNKQHKCQGRLDIPLNQEGISQAHQTALLLKNTKIDTIYTSPLIRAKHTAQIINQYHNVSLIESELITEIELGDLSGIVGHHDIDVLADLRKKELAQKHNAEHFELFYNRCVEFYNSIKDENKTILIVSHSGVGYQLKKYLNLNLDETINNCEVLTLKS